LLAQLIIKTYVVRGGATPKLA